MSLHEVLAATLCYIYSWVWGQHSNGQRSPPPICTVIRRHLGLHRQEEPSIKDTKYLIACAKSNMCATMHVQKDLKLWSLIFKGHRDDLRQNVKKRKQSENPLNIALLFQGNHLSDDQTHFVLPILCCYFLIPHNLQRSRFAVQQSMTMPPNLILMSANWICCYHVGPWNIVFYIHRLIRTRFVVCSVS